MELGLVASFLPILGHNKSHEISFVRLANAGFYHTGIGTSVRCHGCTKMYDLGIFLQNGCMVDASQSMFHDEHCVFTTNEDRGYGYENCIANTDEGIEMNTKHDRSQSGVSFNCDEMQEASVSAEVVKNGSLQTVCQVDSVAPKTSSEDLHCASIQVDGHGNIEASTHDIFSVSHSESSHGERSTPDQSQEQKNVQATSEVNDAGYVSDNSDTVFVDRDLFHYEFAIGAKTKHGQAIHRTECTKNPGHFAYFPINGIKEQQIPSKCRHPEFIKFLHLLAILTVRIVISVTSRDRNKSDPALRSTSGTDERRCRTGTGFVSLTEQGDLPGQNDPLDDNHRRKWGNIKKYVKNLVKKNKELIYIETNRHLVFNDEEAANTTVEFFYDDPAQRGVKVIKGVGVIHSKIIGDHRSILLCQTSDHDLLHQLNKTREEVLELAERLPRRAKEAMCKKLFIINHPHGGEKVLSYGDSVMVKYDLQKDARGRVDMTKINNPQQVADKDNVRKMLLYAADTCEGSSGAPIFTFKRGPPNDQGQAKLVLDVWMHNGVDKTHSLGGSVMKVCAPDDFAVQQTPDTTHLSADSDDEDGPGHQEVTSPVFKVLSHPSYPVYITYQKRVETYVSWVFSQIHSPEYLALAGFFYAGYSDCVRCFQCGLGLRSWKAGDDVYDQHQKHRPHCPYLQAHGKPVSATNHTEANRAADSETGKELDVTKNTTLTLLEKENRKLQEQLTCKVCHKQPIKDLFLPCGELYACTECSKLLTHCPSCNKQILATVTTYFS